MKNLPEYVSLNGTALKFIKNRNNYYRHAGDWYVNYYWKENKLFSKCRFHKQLNNVLLVEITKEEWAKDNTGYI